jgi:large subunit ribosomal protein L10
MPTAQKERVVEQAKEWYGKSVGLVFTDYRGLKVKDLQQLRRSLSEKGAEIHVIKNTLFRMAAGEDLQQFPDELHNGPTAIAFIFENESECSKVLVDFEKQSKSLSIKGGFFAGKVFDAKGVETLSKLPSRETLIAQVIGLVASPLSNLVGVIEALYADPIRTIGAVADKVAEGAPVGAKAEAPAAEAAPADEKAAEEPADAAAAAAAEEAPAAEAAGEEVPAEQSPSEEPTAEAPAETPANESNDSTPEEGTTEGETA